ncbi:MAG: hypothetical protein SFT90_04555 [Rickettsiales bacterium]|nr:hypothetical protein [Rickettsiales bacterium]
MIDQQYKHQENLNEKIQKILGVDEAKKIHGILEEIKEALGEDFDVLVELLGQAEVENIEKDTEKLIAFIVSSLKIDKKYLLKPKLKKALLKYVKYINEITEDDKKNSLLNKLRAYGHDIMELIQTQEIAQGKGQDFSKMR